MQPLASLLASDIPLALGTDCIGQAMSRFVDIMLAARSRARRPSSPTRVAC